MWHRRTDQDHMQHRNPARAPNARHALSDGREVRDRDVGEDRPPPVHSVPEFFSDLDVPCDAHTLFASRAQPPTGTPSDTGRCLKRQQPAPSLRERLGPPPEGTSACEVSGSAKGNSTGHAAASPGGCESEGGSLSNRARSKGSNPAAIKPTRNAGGAVHILAQRFPGPSRRCSGTRRHPSPSPGSPRARSAHFSPGFLRISAS